MNGPYKKLETDGDLLKLVDLHRRYPLDGDIESIFTLMLCPGRKIVKKINPSAIKQEQQPKSKNLLVLPQCPNPCVS